MSTKIGRFEILSQLAESSWSTVYKAVDPEARQTVALKVVPLDRAQDASALMKAVFDEADQARPLASHNIAVLYGVGDEDGQLLAASEYVEGNSIATTLARKDGFSIWDLEDIARQVSQALDHAQFHKAVHRSLEPAKVVAEWDGTVKVLGFGISTMNSHAASLASVPSVLHYTAPEELRGDPVDHRAALFSLGAILYEMATGEKAFPGDAPDEVRAAILEALPPLPHRLKANLSHGLSALIMKALSKSPAERYQSGRELVADLERSKALVTPVAPRVKTQTMVSAPQPNVTIQAAARPTAAFAAQPATVTPSFTSPPEAPPVGFKFDLALADNSPASPAAAKSFSDISELPPLKETDLSLQPPVQETAVSEPLLRGELRGARQIETKALVRATAKHAIAEIRKIPPRLFLYGLGGALVVIAMIAGGIVLHSYFEERDQERPSANLAPPVPSARPQAPVSSAPPPSQPVAEENRQNDQPVPSEPPDESASPARPVRQARGTHRRDTPSTLARTSAALTISSSPAGADISFDGKLLCQSPCTLTDIPPGQHLVAATKPGYGPESRSLQLASGANSTLSLELNPLAASVSVASTPAGAVILMDGQDTGRLTPSELTLTKPGTHTVLLRRTGYLEESSSIEARVGQIATVNLALKKLGSTEDIRPVAGKFKKLLGHRGSSNMGIVSVKTQPKGAQIMLNNRVLDKTAPFDFYLNPGTYVIDISLSGYHGVHRVINVEELDKIAIDETLTPD